METIAFKPYACGTMTQPYIDCAIALAERGVQAEQIRDIVCEVGEGTVHRLWEELAVKHRPPTAYAAKFSTPFCMAVGFFDRKAGFSQFTEARIHDPEVLALAGKIRYEIDPENEYPTNFTGHLRATLNDGTVQDASAAYARRRARTAVACRTEAKSSPTTAARWLERSPGARGTPVCDEVFAQTTMAGAARFRR